ncbi:hypothetical protein BU17DRAFT_77045 [Hysterangium stoloniferum]|nr:hypothetical protein BU17DRAFT_77045 [Hysterangium stoloniferum]
MNRTAKDKAWSWLGIFILLIVTIVNCRAFWHAVRVRWLEKQDYTYVEFDFPPSLVPLSKHPYIAQLTIEDSVHYAPNASDEWESLFPPGGGGFVRLGPDHRLFGVSMFHQLHCLNKVRHAVLERPPSPWERWHTQHCLNYLRQMFLCAANVRLEPVTSSSAHGMVKVDGLGLQHTCRDWSILRDIAEKNYESWPADAYP